MPPNSFPADQADPQSTDAELFRRLASGQTEALGQLYDRHAGLVHSIALQLLSNAQEAEDLTQDIFLNLVRKNSYDPKRGSLRTYLAILTRSRAIDRLRSRQRQQEKLKTDVEIEKQSEALIEEISQIEQSQQIQAALASLPELEQQVLRMAYYQGLSQSEISEQLDIALGTVKSRSRRGLIKLRQALADFMGA